MRTYKFIPFLQNLRGGNRLLLPVTGYAYGIFVILPVCGLNWDMYVHWQNHKYSLPQIPTKPGNAPCGRVVRGWTWFSLRKCYCHVAIATQSMAE